MSSSLLPLGSIVSAALLLVSCDDSPSNVSGNSSEAIITIDSSGNESGNVSVNLPGISANISLPTEMMTGGKFDIDGVPLFPGSKVSNVKIGTESEAFSMKFDAPAEPSKVAAWFQERFVEKSLTVSKTNKNLSGKTSDGNTFTIDLAPAAGGHSTGTITIIDAKK